MVPKAATTFAVSLQRGADAEHADLHLHLSARLGDAPVVVRNSRSRGSWGVEEPLEGPFPFPAAPRTFLLVITAYVGCYEVEVNGSAHFTFKVRDGLPLSDVTHLAIQAGLLLRAIHIPVESMPRNLRLSIPGGAQVGDLFYLKGEPTAGALNFVVNWQSGPGKFDDILFHLSPQLDQGRVVRNSRIDDEWGAEDALKEMPFSPGTPFALEAGVSSLSFETRLDGKELGHFTHRQDSATACTLFLEGDLRPSDVRIDSAQLDPAASLLNGKKLKSRGVRLQSFASELPFSTRVTGGFEKGCLFLLSCRAAEHPSRFSLSLQCDDATDSDVALRYEIRWGEDSPSFFLNSREEEAWGQEVSLKEDGGLGPGPGQIFDLIVARLEGCFRTYLNGVEQTEFPYRLEDLLPNHLVIEGDASLQRVLVV